MRCAAAAAVIRDGSFARTASKMGSTHPACTAVCRAGKRAADRAIGTMSL